MPQPRTRSGSIEDTDQVALAFPAQGAEVHTDQVDPLLCSMRAQAANTLVAAVLGVSQIPLGARSDLVVTVRPTWVLEPLPDT